MICLDHVHYLHTNLQQNKKFKHTISNQDLDIRKSTTESFRTQSTIYMDSTECAFTKWRSKKTNHRTKIRISIPCHHHGPRWTLQGTTSDRTALGRIGVSTGGVVQNVVLLVGGGLLRSCCRGHIYWDRHRERASEVVVAYFVFNGK